MPCMRPHSERSRMPIGLPGRALTSPGSKSPCVALPERRPRYYISIIIPQQCFRTGAWQVAAGLVLARRPIDRRELPRPHEPGPRDRLAAVGCDPGPSLPGTLHPVGRRGPGAVDGGRASGRTNGAQSPPALYAQRPAPVAGEGRHPVGGQAGAARRHRGALYPGPSAPRPGFVSFPGCKLSRQFHESAKRSGCARP
jgi:hypothetical protein